MPGPVSVTVLLGVAVPETVGVVEAVLLLAGALIATVGVATTVTVTGWVAQPPAVQAVTVSVDGPVGTVTSQLKVPEVLAVVVHRVWLPGPVIVTSLPGVAVPETGWVVGPGWGCATVRLAGPTAVKLVTAGVEVPPALLATAVMLVGPAGTVTLHE